MIPQKVLVLGPLPPPYEGVAVMTQNILQASQWLDRWQLLHFNLRKPGGLTSKGALNFGNLFYSFAALFGLVGELLRRRPAIVHAALAQNRFGFLRDAALVLIVKAFRKRVLLHAFGGSFNEFSSSQGPVVRRVIVATLRLADRVAVVSPGLGAQFDGLVDSARIVAIPNAIDTEFDPPQGDPHDGVNVLYLGKISVAKGAVDFARAACALKTATPALKVRFRLVGSLLEREWNISFIDNPHGVTVQIRRALERPGCRDAIELGGEAAGDSKWRELANADIFVIPSYSEGLPLTLLEAMAAGLPVIATSVGAVPHLLPGAQQPFIVSPGDVDGLVGCIYRLANDPSLRRTLGGLNRQLVRDRYSLKTLAANLAAVYEELAR